MAYKLYFEDYYEFFNLILIFVKQYQIKYNYQEQVSMYKVERILDKRQTKKKGKFQYLVKWEGWSEDQSTWQPEVNLKYVKEILNNYEKGICSNESGKGENKNQKAQQKEKTVEDTSIEKNNGKDKTRKKQSANKLKEKKSPSEAVSVKGKQKKTEKTIKQFQNNKNIAEDYEQKFLQQQSKERTVDCEKVIPQLPAQTLCCTNKRVQILGMKKENESFWYYVNENGEEVWCLREYVIEKYPRILCQFYEARLIFE